MPYRGIDISEFQGNVDFKAVKNSGIDFVILRAGFGRETSQKDSCFEKNYKNAVDAGLDVGCYWYSYADSKADAIKEARACLDVIKNKKFNYPIFYDIEEQSQFEKGSKFINDIISGFCDELLKNNYYSGIYMSVSPFEKYVISDNASKYPMWLAQYYKELQYSGDVGVWQYEVGSCDGVKGNVCLDISYKNYSNYISKNGYNGYSKTEKTEYDIAKEVIDGKWGNGDERKQKLKKAG